MGLFDGQSTNTKVSTFALCALLILVSACAGTYEEREKNVRPGCVDDQIRDNDVSRSLALVICEGEALLFGTDSAPDYEKIFDDLKENVDESLNAAEDLSDEYRAWLNCMEEKSRDSSIESCEPVGK